MPQTAQLFQSLKGIIGDFNLADMPGVKWDIKFQSLKGIIGDFNPLNGQ